jgi:hypothetical protein
MMQFALLKSIPLIPFKDKNPSVIPLLGFTPVSAMRMTKYRRAAAVSFSCPPFPYQIVDLNVVTALRDVYHEVGKLSPVDDPCTYKTKDWEKKFSSSCLLICSFCGLISDRRILQSLFTNQLV